MNNPLIGESSNALTAGRVVGPVTPEAYRANGDKRGDPKFVMGRSSLMEFARCPKRWLDGYESEETKATEWGDLVDCLYLTPDQFKNRYAVQPSVYLHDAMQCPVCKSITDSMSCKKCKTQRVPIRVEKEWNSNSDTCAEWESQQAGKTIVKHKLFQPACDAVKILQDNPVLKSIKECSTSQVMATATYQDAETGIVVPIHILIDLLPDKDSVLGKSIIDLKTTTTAAMRPWRSHVYTFNYDAQAALYLDVWTINTGEDRCDFRHIVQESYAPYQTELRLMSAEFIEIGRMKYQAALSRYAGCLDRSQKYSAEVEEIKAQLRIEKNPEKVNWLAKRLKEIDPWPGYDADTRTIDGWQLTEPEPWMVQ